MTDMYVYHFKRMGPSGEPLLSNRRATIDRIQLEGEAVMESQLVVDHTEVDDNGFVIGHADAASHPRDALWTQIRSLEQREKSRDFEALRLDERSEAAAKYMLSLESRELRKQAQALRAKRIDMLIRDLEHQIHPRASIQFAASPTSG